MNNTTDKHWAFCEQIDPNLALFADSDDATDMPLNPYPLHEELTNVDELYTDPVLIDEGGMKQIFTVHDIKSNRTVAMARIKEGADKETCEKFLREARITASLQHPNILSVYDIGVDQNGKPFFTMEFIQSEHLGTIISRVFSGDKEQASAFSIIKRLSVFSSICDAVSYAHSRGVLHLDLKPDNIFIGEYGEVYLYDWGLAKLVSDDDCDEESCLDRNILNDVTNTGFIKGTPGYMAPEQISRDGEKCVSTDVYSLGALLYTLLTGEKHVCGGTAMELIDHTLKGNIIAPSKRGSRGSMASGLEAVILKALQFNQKDRYQSVEALNVDIRNYLSGFATMAEQAGLFTRTLLLISRHRKLFTVIVLSFVFAVVILLSAYLKVREERHYALDQQQIARKEKQIAENNLALYLQAQKAKQSMELSLSPILQKQIRTVDLSHINIQLTFLDQYIHTIDSSKKDMAYEKKGILHFIFQQFEEAEDSFNRIKGKSSSIDILSEATRVGLSLKKGDGKLSDDQLVVVMASLKLSFFDIIQTMYEKHLRWTNSSSRTLPKYAKLAHFMLYAENNLWREAVGVINHDYTADSLKGRFDLSHSSIRNLRLKSTHGTSMLGTVAINELDLSYSDFNHFNQFDTIHAKTINVTGCQIQSGMSDYWLKRMKHSGVEKIILDPKGFSDRDLITLRKYFIIIDGAK